MTAFSPFAKRSCTEHTLNPFTLKSTELRNKGVSLVDLTISNPTLCQFQYLNKDLLTVLQHSDNLFYKPDSRGLLSARQTIAAYYQEKGIHVEPHQIIITASTSEAYTFLFKLLFNPNDVLLVSEPNYPLLDYLAHFNDLYLEKFPPSESKHWEIQLPDPKSTHAKSFLIVNPHNPTGHYVSARERILINQQAQQCDWSLIADEVFLDYPLENTALKNSSFANNEEVLTFTLSGISKVLGLPQMKLSWIVVSGPAAQKEAALEQLEVIVDAYLSASTPIQNALPSWMREKDSIQNEILTRIRANYKFLVESTKGMDPIKVSKIEGGWCVPIQLRKEKTDEVWVLHFLEAAHTIVHPGYLYDLPEASWMVVSLLIPEQTFQDGIRRILKAL